MIASNDKMAEIKYARAKPMSTAEQDLSSFTSFAFQRISAGASNVSIEELFDQWRAENPSAELLAENIAAVRASVADFQSGERGTLAGEHSAHLRREFKV
jgi:hypothetical protein